MGDKTTAHANQVLDTYLSGSTLALLASDPGKAGTLTSEVSGGGYARQSIAFSAASSGATSNTGAVEFGPILSGTWTFRYWAIVKSGIAIYYGDFGVSRTLGSGDTFVAGVGDIDVSED
jgi:hypothetical protein